MYVSSIIRSTLAGAFLFGALACTQVGCIAAGSEEPQPEPTPTAEGEKSAEKAGPTGTAESAYTYTCNPTDCNQGCRDCNRGWGKCISNVCTCQSTRTCQ